MAALGTLVASLALDFKAFESGVDRSSQDALRFGKLVQDTMDRVAGSAKTATSAIGSTQGPLNNFSNWLATAAANGADLSKVTTSLGATAQSVRQISGSLDNVGTSLGAAGSGATSAAKGLDSFTASAHGTASALDDIIARGKYAVAQMQLVAAQQQRGVGGASNLSTATTSLGATGFGNLADLEKAGTSLGAAATQSQKATQGLQAVGTQSKLTGNQIAQLSAQFQDLFVQIQAGGSPLTALIQQGSGLASGFGGVKPALQAVASLFTVARVAAGGAAAAVIAVALAAKQGRDEFNELNKSLVLSGNFAGKTAGQLQDLAAAQSRIAGTQGKAAESIGQLAASGQVAGNVIGKLAQSSIAFERAGGGAAEEVNKKFIALGKDPLAGLIKLNESENFLTKALYDQVKALQDQGRLNEAATVAQKGYAAAVDQTTAQLESKLGTFEKAWRGLGDAAKWAWDRMLNIGRPETVADAIATAEAGVTAARKRLEGNGRRGGTTAELRGSNAQEDLAAAQALADTRREGARLEERVADLKGVQATRAKAIVDTEKAVENSLSSQARLNKEIESTRTQMELAGRSPEQIAAAITAITQGSAAFAQSVGVQMAKIDGQRNAALDATKSKEMELRRQVEAGTLSQFALDRELAALKIADINTQISALDKQREVIASQREPYEALARNDNEREALARERLRLMEKEAQVVQDLVDKYDGRNPSPTELFRVSERQADQGIDDSQKQQRIELTAAIQDQARALQESNRELSLEASLIGKTSDERGIALQQLRIQMQLERQIEQIRKNTPAGKQRDDDIAAATANAQQSILNVATQANIDYIADLLDPTRAKTFGEALTAAFDGAGNSLVKLINTLEDYGSKSIAVERKIQSIRADNNLDPEKKQQGINAAIQEQEKLQVGAYASMAGAAKGFFQENSRGYKALEAVETGFRAIQIIGVAQETAAKILGLQTVTNATVAEEVKRQVAQEAFRASELAADAGHAAASIAQSQAVGAASAAPAIAKEGSISGIYGALAMAALLAALGYATGAFGGKSKGGAFATADQRQGGAATGRLVTADQLDSNNKSYVRGTVFGDDQARSESIAKSIDLLADRAKLELDYSRSQLSALEAIRDSLAGLGNLVLRSVGGGLTSGKNLGVFQGTLSVNEGDPILKGLTGINDSSILKSLGPLGNFASKLQSLWGKTTQKIVDSGLEIMGTMSDLAVRQYADVETTRSSLFGLIKKSSSSTVFGSESDVQDIANQFRLVFKLIGDSVESSAVALGRDGGEALQQAIAKFPIAIERLSLKDLKGADAQEKLNSAVNAAADDLAKAIAPGLDDFKQIGKGYYETLVQVASGIEMADYQLGLLGLTAIEYTDIIRKQGDVAAEIIRQSIVGAETQGGKVSSVGAIVNTLSGGGEDIAGTYRQLLDVRTALIKVGESGEYLTTKLLRGAGGLDALADSLGTYFSEFFTEQEQFAANTTALRGEFAKLGQAFPETRDGFKSLVSQLLAGGDATADLAAKVLGLSGDYDKFADTLEKRKKDTTDTQNGLQIELLRAQGKEIEAVNLERRLELAALAETETALGVAAGSFTGMKAAIYAAADAAKELERSRSLASGIDSVVTGFLSGPALSNYFADRILQTLAEVGINGTQSGVLGSTKQTILDLWNVVGIDGKEAILKALPMWEQLQDQMLKTAGTANSVADLLAAVNEFQPQTQTLVDKWREAKTLQQALQEAWNDIWDIPADTPLAKAQALHAKYTAMLAVIDSNIGAIDNAIIGRGDQSSVDLLKQREKTLSAEYFATNDPKIAQAWSESVIKRIQIEGQLREKALQDQYQAEYDAAMETYNIAKQTDTLLTKQQRAQRDSLQEQIDSWTKMKELAKQLPDILDGFRAGNLSNLSYTGRLSAQRSLFERSLETGNDPQGQLNAYLQQAQQVYGGATTQYSNIFNQALAEFEAKVKQGAIDADAMLPNAVRQLNGINKIADAAMPELKKAVVDTSNDVVTALGGLNTTFNTGLNSIVTEIGTWLTTVNGQVTDFQTLLTTLAEPYQAPISGTPGGGDEGYGGGAGGAVAELSGDLQSVNAAIGTSLGELKAEAAKQTALLLKMIDQQSKADVDKVSLLGAVGLAVEALKAPADATADNTGKLVKATEDEAAKPAIRADW